MLSKILTRAGDLCDVHPQLARLQSIGLHLLIGNLLEGAGDQVLPCLLHVAAQSLAEVVQCAQIEFAFPDIPVAQGIAHLQVIDEGIMCFFVAPAKARLEHFHTHQHIDRCVGAGWLFAVQYREGFFLQAAEELPVVDACPQDSSSRRCCLGERWSTLVNMAVCRCCLLGWNMCAAFRRDGRFTSRNTYPTR